MLFAIQRFGEVQGGLEPLVLTLRDRYSSEPGGRPSPIETRAVSPLRLVDFAHERTSQRERETGESRHAQDPCDVLSRGDRACLAKEVPL